MHRQILTSAAILALVTACSGGADSSDTDAATGSDGAAPTLTPGMWNIGFEITESKLDGTLPGMPDNAAEGFAAMVGQKNRTDKCITPEIAKDFTALINPAADDATCTTDSSNHSGSKIDVAMTCRKPIVPNGPLATENRSTTGEVTADKMDLVTNSVTKFEDLTITTAMRFTGNRTGDCPSE